MRKCCFDNLLKVLDRGCPEKPILFEFFLNEPLYKKLAGEPLAHQYPDWPFGTLSPMVIQAFYNAGYDYATCRAGGLSFINHEAGEHASISLNASTAITDRDSFENFNWPKPDVCDFKMLGEAADWLPPGMKLIVFGPEGILENVVGLAGYDNLCLMIHDDPELAKDLFDKVGAILLRYYQICLEFDTVGAIICNDDWGYKTQTMLSPDDLRRYVFEGHKRIVRAAHAAGRPAILHSCGNLDAVMDDIIDDMQYDGKHSFEDTIRPVEDAWDRYGRRIAILGGIDLDFLCTSSPEQIRQRCDNLLKRTGGCSYALGTGNSIPEYVPDEHYFAMIDCVRQKTGMLKMAQGA